MPLGLKDCHPELAEGSVIYLNPLRMVKGCVLKRFLDGLGMTRLKVYN